MKNCYSFISILLMALMLFFTSCEKQENPEDMQMVAVPVTMSVADFRASVSIQEPKTIEQSGKIYAYGNYLFINDVSKGVHIIDNSDSRAPEKLNFLKIPQNTDISVKDDMLFANSGMDLVVFDISDLNNIKQVERIEEVFQNFQPPAPEGTAYVDTQNVDFNAEIITGYVMEKRKIERAVTDGWMLESTAFNADVAAVAGGTGTGGSMARFNIKDDYLYVAGINKMNVFDISELDNPKEVFNEYVGWQIETIFNQGDYMYLGSATGMFIYSIENREKPTYVSEISHVMGCDPVVVDGDTAYVTIRGGNACGQNFSQLEVIDVSDKENPQLLKTYEMDSPYGLGFKDNWLFVCDGDSGLKIYDKTESPELTLTDHFQDINTYDVIPLEDKLLMIGGNTLHQYTYKNNQINLLSSFNLN